MFSSIGRTSCGFIAQYMGVFVSTNVFTSPGGTIFWWTQSAVTIAAMVHTPDQYWPERMVHVATGMVSYILFRYKKFSIPLLAAVCASNGLGQVFGYMSVKRFYPTKLSQKDVGTLRFLGVFFLFPVIVASLVASIPGSLSFKLFLGSDVVLSAVAVNYSLGHISGTATLLYPLIIVPVLWENETNKKNETSKKTSALLLRGTVVLAVVSALCAFRNYHLLGFSVIVALYGLVAGVSAYMVQLDASILHLGSTAIILAFTSADRGPFVYVIKGGGARSVLIGTQMGMTALLALGAFTVITVSSLRALESIERESRLRMEALVERQTLDLYRIGHDMNNNSTLVRAVCETMGEDHQAESMEIVKAINVVNGVLVSDMVDMVSGKQGPQRVLDFEDVDVMEMMHTYLMVARGMILLEGKEERITPSLPYTGIREAVSDPVSVYTNRERLHQVMVNLVSNAVKYTQRGTIHLEVDGSDKDAILVRVADSGIGLSEEDVSKYSIFFTGASALPR